MVAPFDHKYEVPGVEVNTTEPPAQNVVAPPAEIVGVAGVGLTITFVAAELPDEHPSKICCTV